MRMSLLTIILLCIPCLSFAADTRPNIVFIMVDDLGYGDLSCYGASDLKTPHIDKLFSSGMRFNQFYANCPVCSPTRASLMTGLYPDVAGVPGVIRTILPNRVTSWGNLRDDVVTLPAMLKQAGYHTAIVGKWHLGLKKPDRPNDKGFDHFHGYLGDMMDDYYTHLRHGNNYMRLNDKLIDPKGHATDLFSDWAIDYLKERTTKKPKQPFFLYLAYNAPHTPIQPPEDWLKKVKAHNPKLSEKRAKLVALIEHLDDGIGRVLNSIKELGIEKETLIIFTSDNGGQVSAGARNAPWNGGKQQMLEGGIRVCTCATWQGKIEAGTVNDNHISMTMDFYPTLAEIAKVKVQQKIDGRSFANVLFGKSVVKDDRPIVWVRREGGGKYGGLAYHAVRQGDWKLLRNTPFEPYQLFNLKTDPQEQRPIPKHKAPAKYNGLHQTLLRHINRAGAVPWK